jgi:riboflavin kinase / FMN adenylyltransferase
MLTFTSLADLPDDFGPSAVTIGKFDGVHAGHRAVIGQLLALAKERGIQSVALTFDRNPLSLLRPEACPDALVSNEQKLELLEGAGVDATLMATFDHAFAALSPEEFAKSVLVDGLHAAVVLVGPDFRFGAKGAGSIVELKDFGARFGFDVVMVDAFTEQQSAEDDRKVSSTWVREALSAGDVATATTLLGRPPSLRAEVVHGLQRGRELGYPTANLSPQVEGLIPADGVYAAWLVVDGERYGAAVSIGNNPTFEGIPDKQVEAHAFDQSFDLYGRTVELEFVQYIRGMQKFSGADALARQMAADEQQIRAILGVPRVAP